MPEKSKIPKRRVGRPAKGKSGPLKGPGEIKTKKQIALVSALAESPDNVSEAARRAGVSVGYAHKLVEQNAAVRRVLEELRASGAALQPWTGHAVLAQDVLLASLSDPDPRIRLEAAKLALAYELGTPVKKSEVEVTKTTHRERFSPVLFRWAMSRMAETGESLAEALAYAEKHQSEVRAWAEGVVTVAAEIVEEDADE